MTITSGPIPLTVVTLYCRKGDSQCEHWRMRPGADECHYYKTHARRIFSPRCIASVLTPDWCPLKETTNA